MIGWAFVGAIAIAGPLVGACGDDASGASCGPGTQAVMNVCVPTDEVCGEGTTFDPSTGFCELDLPALRCAAGTTETATETMTGIVSECVPDGSVLCASGTRYDATSGSCVPEIGACGERTVLVDGVCVPFDDTLVGDMSEGIEPNDTRIAGAIINPFELPAIDATITFDGCVVPADFDGDGDLDIDYDSWTLDVDAPTWLDITIDGTGGLSAAYAVTSPDPALRTDGWVRYGVDLTADGASRAVLLPKAGSYVLSFTDGRTLLNGLPAGGDGACYFAQVTPRTIPAPTPIAERPVTGTLADPALLSMTVAEAALVFATLADESPAARGALVGWVDGVYRDSAVAVDGLAAVTLADLHAESAIVLIVDHVYDIALDPVPYTLVLEEPAIEPAPVDGSLSITHDGGPAFSDRAFAYFEAAAHDVTHLTVSASGDALAVAVIDPAGNVVGELCSLASPCPRAAGWLQIATTGRHYLAVSNADGVDGGDYTLQIERRSVPTVDLALGVPAEIDLGTTGRGFARLDRTAVGWARFAASSLVGLTEAAVGFYPARAGLLDTDLARTGIGSLTEAAGLERVLVGERGTVLVAIEDVGAVAGTERLTLTIDAVPHTDLGTVTEATPVAGVAATIPAGEPARFVVRASEGTRVSVAVAPGGTEDLRIERLDVTGAAIATVNAAGAGETETLTATLATGERWLAFTVDHPEATPATVTVTVTAEVGE